MLTYKIRHIDLIGGEISITDSVASGCYNEVVPPFRIYKTHSGSITIDIYKYLENPYELIIEMARLYFPHHSAEVIIYRRFKYTVRIDITKSILFPNYVGNNIPVTEIYFRVIEIVKNYYPNFEFREFFNGFLFRPLCFINNNCYDKVSSELIHLYNIHRDIWVTFGVDRSIVVSI